MHWYIHLSVLSRISTFFFFFIQFQLVSIIILMHSNIIANTKYLYDMYSVKQYILFD